MLAVLKQRANTGIGTSATFRTYVMLDSFSSPISDSRSHWYSQELEDSLACPHTATDAATALNKIYSTMQEKAPEGGLFLKRWARVLLRPELRHVESACDALEQALVGQSKSPIPPDEDIAGILSISNLAWPCPAI